MKRIVSIPLILSFLGIALFGFAFFDMDMSPSHMGGCVASAIDGTVCPINVADAAAHHLSAWQSFTSTLVSPISGWSSLIVVLLLVAVSVFLFHKYLLYSGPQFVRQRLRDLTLDSLFSKQKIVSWLSLFELSPAF